MAIVAKYGAVWCGPCKKSKPGYLAIQESYKNKKVTFYEVDIDDPSPDFPDFVLNEIKNIDSIPYVIVKNANNDKIIRMKGWNEGDVRKEIEYSLPKEKGMDYSVIKPGTIINSDNEDDVEISEEEEEISKLKVSKLKEKEEISEEED